MSLLSSSHPVDYDLQEAVVVVEILLVRFVIYICQSATYNILVVVESALNRINTGRFTDRGTVLKRVIYVRLSLCIAARLR